MLQRIQTLYLAIAALACVLLFFFPLAAFFNELEGNYKLFIYGIRSLDPEPRAVFSLFFTLPLIVLVIVSILLTLLTIFSYKKRWLQVRLNAFNVITNIVVIMLIFFYYAPYITGITKSDPEYNYIGMILPLITLAMLILATRAIKKDEALVKSADRLR